MTIDDTESSIAASGGVPAVDAGRDTPPAGKGHRRPGSAPGWLVWSMIVLASVVAIGASMNAWLNRQLLDTDNWVDASDQILEEPAVRAALSTYLVNELFSYVDVSAQLEDRLPDSLQILAGPISQALRQPAIDGVDRLLATPKVQAAWSEANRLAHQTLVRILEDDTRDGVSTTDGVVTLQLGTLVTELGMQIGLPTSVLDRIPPDAGTIVVADSRELADAQQAVQVVKVMSVFLLIVVIVLYAAAVFIASDRRVALRNAGLAIIVSALALLVARKIGVSYITDSIERADTVKQAARAVALIGTGILNEIAWTGFAIGFLMLVYALLVGPTRAAYASRRGLSPILTNRFTAWVLALAILVLVVLITPGTGVQTWIGRATLLVLVIVGVERLHAQTRREHPDTSWSKVLGEARDWFEDDAPSTTTSVPDAHPVD
jgi:hypothetical protein